MYFLIISSSYLPTMQIHTCTWVLYSTTIAYRYLWYNVTASFWDRFFWRVVLKQSFYEENSRMFLLIKDRSVTATQEHTVNCYFKSKHTGRSFKFYIAVSLCLPSSRQNGVSLPHQLRLQSVLPRDIIHVTILTMSITRGSSCNLTQCLHRHLCFPNVK